MSTISYIHSHVVDNPELLIQEYRAKKSGAFILSVQFRLDQYWLAGSPNKLLTALYLNVDGAIHIAISEDSILLPDESAFESSVALFEEILYQNQLPVFLLEDPLSLEEIIIDKPWGREIWHTGIESRGTSMVRGRQSTKRGADYFGRIPLPWILAAAPCGLTGGLTHNLILLKILDPLADPNLGDLYFELHQEKQEVYVVTHINDMAWPEGKGAIRMGFSQSKLKEYDTETEFRESFLTAVMEYQKVRNVIDDLVDKQRAEQGYSVSESLAPDVAKQFLSKVPRELRECESESRKNMYSFTDLIPLSVGDVVKIPTFIPHALQHGVRAVEFQTPVYERMILSFGQKVLTQSHWDTERAIELMQLELGGVESFETERSNEGVCIDKVVDFEDFFVLRIVCEQGASFKFATPKHYALLIVIQGFLKIDDFVLESEQSCLIPSQFKTMEYINMSSDPVVFLQAMPTQT